LIVVNLSQKSETAEIEGAALPFETSAGSWSQLFGDGKSSVTQSAGTINLTLAPLGYLVVGLSE
jgi:hypothetical protein